MASGVGVDVVTTDDNVIEIGEHIQDHCLELNNRINKYIEIMESISERGFSEGKTSEAILAFAETARLFKDQLEEYGNVAELTCRNFVSLIDKADSYLY